MTPTGTARAARTPPVIDLHTHSTVSDGTETPTELVAAAAVAGVDVLAITDHDTVAGWAEAAEAARVHGVTLVRGIEISCAWRHSSIHLLGYLIDADDGPLAAELARARESRSTRLERMVALMAADGIPLGYDEVLAQVGPGATPGGPTSRTPSSPTARSATATRRSSRGSATTRPTTSATTRPTPSGPSSSCGRPVACP